MNNHIHPTAIIEANVHIGQETSVWDNVHIRRDTSIGNDCIIGEKSSIAYGVSIGNRVKINSHVSICFGVTIEDGVMISAGTVFTNDRFPRATTSDLSILRGSEPDERTLRTTVRTGATLGANCTIGPGIEVGMFAMIGMGSVVTRSVPAFHLVLGNPARSTGCICRCGELVEKFADLTLPCILACNSCGYRYTVDDDHVVTETRN